MDTLCLIRDIYRSIGDFEANFQQTHDLCLNEGMLLCTSQKGKLSSGEIAEALGTSRVVVSRVLKDLEKQGFIKLHRKEIELL